MSEPVPLLARLMITAATIAYGVGPFIVDMNKTHLLHPGWMGHARFHLFWAASSQLAIAGVALWLLWGPGELPHCRLAATEPKGSNLNVCGRFYSSCNRQH